MEDRKEERLCVRLTKGIKELLNKMAKETSLNHSEIIELGIVDLASRMTNDLNYYGISLKNYAENIRLRRLRRIVSMDRVEFMSKNLLISRINSDIFKLLSSNKRTEKIYTKIKDYILFRKTECIYYKDNKDILNELDTLEKNLDEKLIQLKKYILEKVEDNKNLSNLFELEVKK